MVWVLLIVGLLMLKTMEGLSRRVGSSNNGCGGGGEVKGWAVANSGGGGVGGHWQGQMIDTGMAKVRDRTGW